MPSYNLRRFAHPEGLKSINPERLMALLKPYGAYFIGRGFSFPQSPSADSLDYERLVEVLMNPDGTTPPDLLDALYYVHEMADPDCMDTLLQEAASNGLTIDGNPDPTAADVAVQIFLQDRSILEREHAKQNIYKPRSFVYFHTAVRPIPDFVNPPTETLTSLERDLNDWYESKKRGRSSKVFVYPKPDGVWFLVRHGDPYKREGRLDGELKSVFYRPEKFDVLVYEPKIGEIRMHVCSKAEQVALRHLFGHHLFQNEDFFPGNEKYTLEPLRLNGAASVVCTDIEGMEWVRLKEIQFFWGGAEKEIEIRKANDLFAAFAGRNRSIPEKTRIIRASFLVKFSDSKSARTVTIRPSNIAHYTRDDDAEMIEEWLQKRGFIISDRMDDEG